MKRREFLNMLAGAASVWPGLAFAQQNQPPKRIGLMAHQPLPPVQRFRERLRALGWEEGKNLIIEYRYAEGRDDRFPEFVAELVSMPVDVLVAWGSPAAFAAKRATTTIPILIGAAGDVVNIGLISNLARPDANLTGFIALNVELESKRLELLKEAIPHLSRVTILANPANPLNRFNLETARRSAEKLGVKIEVVEARAAADIESALTKVLETRPDAVLLASDTLMLSKRKEIADFMAATHSGDLSVQRVCRRRRPVHLRREHFRPVRTCGRLPGQAAERREGRQFARAAGDSLRIDRQFKSGGGAWACHTAKHPASRG